MKSNLRKIFSDKYVQVAASMLFILTVLLVPLLWIGVYAHPCADDYTYGYLPHAFWTTTHSLSQTLKWAFEQVKGTYDTWQGTFSSVFFMAMSPAIWGEGFYFFTPIIMLGMNIGSHFYLLYVIIVKLLKKRESMWIITSSVIALLLIQTVYSPVNAFFWYNGSVHYNFMHSCMIFLFGFILNMGQSKKAYKEVLLCCGACLMALMCGGANYSTALLGILGSSVIIVFKWFQKKKAFWFICPLIVYGIAFYLNVTAYGNQIRQTYFNKNTPLNAILQSFNCANDFIKECISLQIVLFALFMIPVFWKMMGKVNYKLWIPIILSFVSYCSIACMFTPSCYAMSSMGPERLLNIIKFWMILLLFLNEGCWIGSIHKYVCEEKLKEKIKVNLDVRYYLGVVLGIIIAVFVFNVENRMYDYSSYAAYVSLKAGEAQQYHQEYLDRVKILESEEKVVVLNEFSVKPRLLFFDDISTDPYNWKNSAVARWYGKEGVWLQQE